MELRRKKEKELKIGGFCTINHSKFLNEFFKQGKFMSSSRRERDKDFKILDGNTFVISKSIFGGDLLSICPLTTNQKDYHANGILNFLKKKKFFYIDKKFVTYATEEAARKDMIDKNSDFVHDEIQALIYNAFKLTKNKYNIINTIQY